MTNAEKRNMAHSPDLTFGALPSYITINNFTSRSLEEVREILKKDRMRQQEKILALPSIEEGLRLDRIEAYRQQRNAPQKPLLFLSPANYDKAREIANTPVSDHEEGQHLFFPNILIIKRDPEMEELNGTEFTESNAVHEIAHANNKNTLVEVTIEDYTNSEKFMADFHVLRYGYYELLDNKPEGLFFEEANSEIERVLYNTHFLNMQGGFGKRRAGQSNDGFTFLAKGEKSKKLYVVRPDGAVPAFILIMLNNRDPEILPLLWSCRESSPREKLQEHIDAFIPGLYNEMKQCNPTTPKGRIQVDNMYKRVIEILDTEL